MIQLILIQSLIITAGAFVGARLEESGKPISGAWYFLLGVITFALAIWVPVIL